MTGEHIPVSVQVLRERGPMTTRQVTAATAERMQCTQMYDDVLAVLRLAKKEGLVTRTTNDLSDYRLWVWEAL